jgi:hypothetical protein
MIPHAAQFVIGFIGCFVAGILFVHADEECRKCRETSADDADRDLRITKRGDPVSLAAESMLLSWENVP